MRYMLAFAMALLSAGALLVPSASAEPAYTPETLAALLPAKATLEFATGLSFSATQDLKPGSDPVSTGRAYAVGNGTFVSINLFSPADGAMPDAALRASLQDGTFLHEAIASTFNVIDRYEPQPSLGSDGNDVAASFMSMVRGETYSVVADAFVRGNVYGVVIHGSTSAVDHTVARKTLALLATKLPA